MRNVKVTEELGFTKKSHKAKQSHSYATSHVLLSKYDKVTIFYPIDMKKDRTRTLGAQKPNDIGRDDKVKKEF